MPKVLNLVVINQIMNRVNNPEISFETGWKHPYTLPCIPTETFSRIVQSFILEFIEL